MQIIISIIYYNNYYCKMSNCQCKDFSKNMAQSIDDNELIAIFSYWQ